MRASIAAQSQLSVPPAPACIFDEGIVAIGLAGQQRFDLLGGGTLPDVGQSSLGLGHDLGVVFGLPQFDQIDIVGQIPEARSWYPSMASASFWRSRMIFCALAGSDHKVRVLGAGIQFLQPVRCVSQPSRWRKSSSDFSMSVTDGLGFGFHERAPAAEARGNFQEDGEIANRRGSVNPASPQPDAA